MTKKVYIHRTARQSAATQRRNTRPQNRKPAPQTKKSGCSGCLVRAVVVGVLAALALLTAFLMYLGGGPSTEPNYEAFLAARRAVQERLKAPSTASFPEDTVRITKPSRDIYTVMGKVDSQNSFGAMMRTSYIVWVDGKNGVFVATGGCLDDTMWGYDPKTGKSL